MPKKGASAKQCDLFDIMEFTDRENISVGFQKGSRQL